MSDTNSETVLIVDDDSEFVSSLERSLTSSGYTVLRAFDAADALGVLNEDLCLDLVIIDLVLPDKSGLELIHGAAKRPSRPKILATSANDSPLHLEIATYMGADAAVSKFCPDHSDSFPAVMWTEIVRNTLDSSQCRKPVAATQSVSRPRISSA